MNTPIWQRGCAVAAALMLLAALPVAAEQTGDSTTTSVATTTTVAEVTTTTTQATTTTTEQTTTTTVTTTAPTTVSTTVAAVTTTKPIATTTKKPVVTTTAATAAPKPTTTVHGVTATTTVAATTTTTTTPSTEPSAPTDAEPVDIAEPYILVGEPGEEHSYVYFCDTDGHYPADILNGNRYEGYTDDWWVEGRNGGLAIRLDSTKGRYLRCSRYLFSNQQNGEMGAFTLSMWVNWQGNGEDDANIGQKLLCLSTQDLDDRWHTGDRLQWDPDTWYAFVSPHMRDDATGLDGIYIAWENQNLYESGEDFSVAGDNTTFALPTNEWHHIAVTMSDSEFVLYVDGHRLYACTGTTELETMAPFLDRFFIGRGMEGDPTLDALIDDALMYPQVLDARHIAMLAAGLDPADGGTAPTTPEYKPTHPATSGTAVGATTAATTRVSRLQANGDKFPVAVVAIPATILLLTVVLSLLLSPKKAKTEEPTDAPDDKTAAEETAAEEPIADAEITEEVTAEDPIADARITEEIIAEEPIADTRITEKVIEPEEDA